MAKKLTYEFVKEEFEKNGFILLEKEYKGWETKMECLCPCKGKTKKTLFEVRKRQMCLKCGYKSMGKKGVFSHDYVKDAFAKKGCLLLDRYSGAMVNMNYICSCGKKSKIKWSKFNLGQSCRNCGINKYSKHKRLTQEYIYNFFKNKKCILLGNYKNSRSKLEYICECGEEFRTSWSSFRRKSKCEKCGLIYQDGTRYSRLNLDQQQGELNYLVGKKSRGMIRRLFAMMKSKKQSNIEFLLGYSRDELKLHLTKHKNWDSIKNDIWSIDHIFPITAFFSYGIINIKLINCLENLQPMLLLDNITKSDKYDKEAFIKWVKDKEILHGVNYFPTRTHTCNY